EAKQRSAHLETQRLIACQRLLVEGAGGPIIARPTSRAAEPEEGPISSPGGSEVTSRHVTLTAYFRGEAAPSCAAPSKSRTAPPRRGSARRPAAVPEQAGAS